MNEIKCPECGKVFSVDEASYASIVNQVRTKELEDEIRRRVAEVEKQQQLKHQSDKLISDQAYQQKLNAKDQEIEKRNADIARLEEQVKSIAISKQAEFDKRLSEKEFEIAQIKEKAQGTVKEKQLENERLLAEKDTRIARLEEQMKGIARDKQSEFDKILAEKESELVRLQGVIEQSNSQTKVAVLEEKNKANEIILSKESEIATLKGKVESEKTDALQREQEIRNNYEIRLKQMQELVEQYKDFKARLSTKMLGESLEVHCSNQYNVNIRPILPYAYFEKDNDASEGSKGDFIFRDYDDGYEYISITCGAVINLLVNLFIGLSVGAGVTVAHGIGANKDEDVRRTVHTAIPLAVICGAVLSVVGIVGAGWILRLMGTPANVIGLSATYMRIYYLFRDISLFPL